MRQSVKLCVCYADTFKIPQILRSSAISSLCGNFASSAETYPPMYARLFPRQIGDLIEVLSFYILRFEEAFCVGAGNAVHIDVAGAQKRQVAVSHIQLKARQVGVAFCVEACVGVAKHVLNPTSAKTRIVPDIAPTALPVCWADFPLF